MSKEELKGAVTETVPKQDEEIIHAPKGRKKGQFLLAFLLAVLVLTTFSVSPQVVDFFACGPSSTGVAMTWVHPTRGLQVVKQGDFGTQARQYGFVLEILTGNRRRESVEQEVAELIIFDGLAEASGVAVTDNELGDFILKRWGSQDVYLQVVKNYRMAPRDFETMLRRLLRSERYKGLITSAVSSPDPAEVERLWKQRHQEYAFEYVQLGVDKVMEEARALAPSGVELETWFKGLSEPERNKYRTEEAGRAEAVYKTIGPEIKAEELLLKYPPASAEPAEVEVRAKNYYDGFYYVRFQNPDFKPDPQNFNPADFYKKYEDVKAQCAVEAPIYDAMMAWIADMNARRQKGEAVDVIAEAQGFRMGFHNPSVPMSRADWSKDGVPGWGRYVADAIFEPSNKNDDIHPAVVVEKNAFVVVRLRERQESRMPEFPEVEARIKEEWIKKKAIDLALAKLEALRDKLGARPGGDDPSAALWRPEVDAETFAKAATEAGYTVERRDWQERNVPQTAGEVPTPIQTFLQQAAVLYSMKETSVPKAEPSRDGQTAFLVRIAGIRDADLAKLTPLDLQTLSQQAAQASAVDLRTRVFSSKDYLVEHFKFHMPYWDEEKKPDAP